MVLSILVDISGKAEIALPTESVPPLQRTLSTKIVMHVQAEEPGAKLFWGQCFWKAVINQHMNDDHVKRPSSESTHGNHGGMAISSNPSLSLQTTFPLL
jgi:hypothetical protein